MTCLIVDRCDRHSYLTEGHLIHGHLLKGANGSYAEAA